MIDYEKRGRIAFVTLDPPEAKNAVDPAMHEALCAAWADFDADDAVDAVDLAILSGAGDTFCAGEANELLEQFYERSDSGRQGS